MNGFLCTYSAGYYFVLFVQILLFFVTKKIFPPFSDEEIFFAHCICNKYFLSPLIFVASVIITLIIKKSATMRNSHYQDPHCGDLTSSNTIKSISREKEE